MRQLERWKEYSYILIKNKKTLSSVNKTLKEVMNIELSLSKGRLQGENHLYLRQKIHFQEKVRHYKNETCW